MITVFAQQTASRHSFFRKANTVSMIPNIPYMYNWAFLPVTAYHQLIFTSTANAIAPEGAGEKLPYKRGGDTCRLD